MSTIKSREMNKQEKSYSPKHNSEIYHSPKPQNFPERQMFNPPKMESQQPEIHHPETID